MVAVIIGGSGSGKSEYAENMAVKLHTKSCEVRSEAYKERQLQQKNELIYIATMEPYGEEGKQRIGRHHQLRAGKGFHTMECYTGLEEVVIPPESTVLLECMSNLTANEYFSKTGVKDKAIEAIQKGLETLIHQSGNLIIVTNNVFEDGFQYDKETLDYMKLLGQVNRWISSRADKVIEIVHGIPL